MKMACNSFLFKALHSNGSERTLKGPFTKRIIIWNCNLKVMEKALPYVYVPIRQNLNTSPPPTTLRRFNFKAV